MWKRRQGGGKANLHKSALVEIGRILAPENPMRSFLSLAAKF
jgi:hypothetical protein